MEDCCHGKNESLEKEQDLGSLHAPLGYKTVGCKWVFALKYKTNGTLDRRKAKLVAKGFTQTYGVEILRYFPLCKVK